MSTTGQASGLYPFDSSLFNEIYPSFVARVPHVRRVVGPLRCSRSQLVAPSSTRYVNGFSHGTSSLNTSMILPSTHEPLSRCLSTSFRMLPDSPHGMSPGSTTASLSRHRLRDNRLLFLSANCRSRIYRVGFPRFISITTRYLVNLTRSIENPTAKQAAEIM